MRGAAYWIDPRGRILTQGRDLHISQVIKYPEKFGWTKPELQAVYAKFNEKFGMEGKAREEIITDIVRKGFIRIRLYPNRYWSITVNKKTPRVDKALSIWAGEAQKDKNAGPHMPVKLLDISTSKITDSNVQDVWFNLKESVIDEFCPRYVSSIKEFGMPKKFKQYINESSLSKVWKYTQEHDYGTITAFRSAPDCGQGTPYSRSDNRKRNKSLVLKLRSAGFAIIKIKGAYIENYGSGDAQEVGESSFIVIDTKNKGNLKKVLMSLGEEFEQDSIIFGKAGSVGVLIGTNKCPNGYPGYHKSIKQGGAVFGKSGEFMSRVNGRPFVFTEDTEALILPPKYPTEHRGPVLGSQVDWKDLD